jgi:hypothetical protein
VVAVLGPKLAEENPLMRLFRRYSSEGETAARDLDRPATPRPSKALPLSALTLADVTIGIPSITTGMEFVNPMMAGAPQTKVSPQVALGLGSVPRQDDEYLRWVEARKNELISGLGHNNVNVREESLQLLLAWWKIQYDRCVL